MDPVTARSCLRGISARLDRRAYTSVDDALSPSTPEYDCSNAMLALSTSGFFWAYLYRKYPPRINTPLLCVGPLRSASRSILMIPVFPIDVFTVMRVGLPKEYTPMS